MKPRFSIRDLLWLALVVALAVGCGQPTASSEVASTAKAYIDSWNRMGMWLPDEQQVSFFRMHVAELQEQLGSELQNPSYEIRMRAAYAIGQIGPGAKLLGPALAKRLGNEPERLVRMYLYAALGNVQYEEPGTIENLKLRFSSLDETKQREPGQSKSDYLDADEKTKIAGALYLLDQGADRKSYLEFILKWLREPEKQLDAAERNELWDRRWGAVLVLEKMPNATEAIALLEALRNEKDAPLWVSVHVPRVVDSLKL